MYVFQKRKILISAIWLKFSNFIHIRIIHLSKKNVIFSSKFQRIFLFKVIFKKEKKIFLTDFVQSIFKIKFTTRIMGK